MTGTEWPIPLISALDPWEEEGEKKTLTQKGLVMPESLLSRFWTWTINHFCKVAVLFQFFKHHYPVPKDHFHAFFLKRLRTVSNLPVLSEEDLDGSPIVKLSFLILENAYKKNFKEIKIESLGRNLKVFGVKESENHCLMVLQPEAEPSIIGFFKFLTNWKDDIPTHKQISERDIYLRRMNKSKAMVHLTYSILESPDGKTETLRISEFISIENPGV